MDKKRMMILGIVLGIGLLGYLVYESNIFFMSGTERLISNKIATL